MLTENWLDKLGGTGAVLRASFVSLALGMAVFAAAYFAMRRLPSSELTIMMIAWCLTTVVVWFLLARSLAYVIGAGVWMGQPVAHIWLSFPTSTEAGLPLAAKLAWTVGLIAAASIGYALGRLFRRGPRQQPNLTADGR